MQNAVFRETFIQGKWISPQPMWYFFYRTFAKFLSKLSARRHSVVGRLLLFVRHAEWFCDESPNGFHCNRCGIFLSDFREVLIQIKWMSSFCRGPSTAFCATCGMILWWITHRVDESFHEIRVSHEKCVYPSCTTKYRHEHWRRYFNFSKQNVVTLPIKSTNISKPQRICPSDFETRFFDPS